MKSRTNRTLKTKLLSLVAAAGFAVGGNITHASAITGLGGSIYGTGGDVTVNILPSFSSFANQIEFFYAWTDTDRNITDRIVLGIDNQLATIDLGPVALGQELIFGIQSPQGLFLTGSGSRNADNLAHAIIGNTATLAGFSESWLVSFEDLKWGGDRDYNDAIFRVSQKAAAVPEPTALALMGIGAIGLGLTRWRRA